MKCYTWIGEANNHKTGQKHIIYGRAEKVYLFETTLDYTEKIKTEMSFEKSPKCMLEFANKHKEFSFIQNLTR